MPAKFKVTLRDVLPCDSPRQFLRAMCSKGSWPARHSVATLALGLFGVAVVTVLVARYAVGRSEGIAALWVYAAAANILSFAAFALDKHFSRDGVSRRTPEVDLLWTVGLGGEKEAWNASETPDAGPFSTSAGPAPNAGMIGGWMAMLAFRHKTQKQAFLCWAGVWSVVSGLDCASQQYLPLPNLNDTPLSSRHRCSSTPCGSSLHSLSCGRCQHNALLTLCPSTTLSMLDACACPTAGEGRTSPHEA